MDDTASLQNLNDIVMPGAVPWWPLAPGWYVLAGLAGVALMWLAYTRWRSWKSNRYRRQAIAELDLIRTGQAPLADLAPLLKRAALAAWPRDTVAGLSGDRWHRFLDESAGSVLFDKGAGELLDRVTYGTAGEPSLTAAEQRRLVQATESWLRGHRRSQGSGA